MSIAAHAWAKRQVAGSPTRKAVLCALADYADAAGLAWPSNATLAADTELSERAVRDAVRQLAEAGLLSIIERTGKSGVTLSNHYRLSLAESDRRECPEGRGQEAPGRGQDVPPRGQEAPGRGQDVPPHYVERSGNHQENPPSLRSGAPPAGGDGGEEGSAKAGKPATPEAELIAEGVPVALLADWKAVRRAKRAGPITETVVAGIRRAAEGAGCSLAFALGVAAERGWQGVNAAWLAEEVERRGPAATPAATGPPMPPRPGLPSDAELRAKYAAKYSSPDNVTELRHAARSSR